MSNSFMQGSLRVASLLLLLNADMGTSAISIARVASSLDDRVQPDGIEARIVIGAAPMGSGNALRIQEAVQGFEFQVANSNWRSQAFRDFLASKGVSPDVSLPAPVTSVDVEAFPVQNFIFSPAPAPAPAAPGAFSPAAAPPPSSASAPLVVVASAPSPGLMAAPMPNPGLDGAAGNMSPAAPAPAPLSRGAARAHDLANAMRAIITTTTTEAPPAPGAVATGGASAAAPLAPAPAATGQPGALPVMEIPGNAYSVDAAPPTLEIRIGADGQEMECTGDTCTQFRDGATVVVPPEEAAAAVPA